MRKTLLLFLIGCMCFFSGHASTIFSLDGRTTTTQKGSSGDTSIGRPRAPRCRVASFDVFYDQEQLALHICSPTDVGIVMGVIENLSTGTFFIFSFDSSVPAVLPISLEVAVWRVTLYMCQEKPIVYEFAIEG